MSEPVFEVEDLSVGYLRSDGHDNVVVWKAAFSLAPGSILGLAGESGCGKSTTALAAIGYRGPGSRILSGTAHLEDVDLLALPSGKLRSIWGRRVAYVAQNATTALNPAIPVGRQLAQPLSRHLHLRGGELRDREVELLESVGIPNPPGALDRYPHQFSGGQQQRIAIAIALSCKPEVLILDEPTTGLDATTQARISALLRSLVAETGAATLYVSHDLSLLSTVADRLAVMYAGEIVEEADSRAVARQPRHPYTQALLAAVPTAHIRSSVAGIPGRPPARVVLDSCSFAPRCPHALDACRDGYIELLDVGGGHMARCIRTDEIAARPLEPRPLATPKVSPEPLLEVEGMWSQYAKAPTPAVRNVSFQVSSGETLGIVGESGSGKTSVGRLIVGLEKPSDGTILIHGQERASGAVYLTHRDTQLIFQDPQSALNPRRSVMRLVTQALEVGENYAPEAQRRPIAEALLRDTGLPTDCLDRFPSQLSGGQRQRVNIGRALGAKPKLIVADEIVSGLDVSVQAHILNCLLDLNRTHRLTMVFISHDLAVVRYLCSRVLMMHAGDIVEEGTTEAVFSNPQHPYTKALLDAVPPDNAGRPWPPVLASDPAMSALR
jgi:peptide/nickel transport system ATP-binding protein